MSKENKKRTAKGQAEMTPDREQPKFEFKYRISNKTLREPLFKQIWGGLVESYGVDDIERPMNEVKEKDTRSYEEQLAEEMENSLPPKEETVTSVAEE